MPANNPDRMLPHNLEAERSVLGAILLDDKVIFNASEILKDENDFYYEPNRIIYRAMLCLMRDDRPCDPIIVMDELRRHDELEKVGGAAYLATLTDGLPRCTNVKHYAEIVREAATMRQIAQLFSNNVQICLEPKSQPKEVIENVEAELFKLGAREIKQGFSKASEIVGQAFKEIEEASTKKTSVTGLSTGFSAFDAITGGLGRKDSVVVAARPGMGKTAFATDILRHVAIKTKKPVGMFSLEMSSNSLIKRMISSEARVDAHKIKTGFLTREEWNRISAASALIDSSPIFIDDSANLTMLQIRSRAQRLAIEHGIELLVVDYLQLVSGSGRRYESRNQEVTEISRGLKNLAKELNIPIIAISQLNREVEKRAGNRKPQLSDLRESGAIEQDADLILFISREEMRNPTEDNSGITEITIAKQRNGATGSFQLIFLKQFTKFESMWQEQEFDYGPIPQN